jgi:predicted AlkP superfamily phosphohydrolase/phosphomutase
MTRKLSLVLLALGLASLTVLPAQAAPSSSGVAPGTSGAEANRVIVLGFDGADGRTAKSLMDAGQLPNLSRLAEQGTFAPLGTTNPAESPVSWASLNTGRNPAETGIVGFVRREFITLGRDKNVPMPRKGLSDDGVMVKLEDMTGQPPIPAWSAPMLGAAFAGAALVVFLIVFGALLRLRMVPTLTLSVVLAAVGFYGGFTIRGDLPEHMPVVKNPMDAEPYWETAARAGVPSVVLDAAQSWDRAPVDQAKVLCGLGVPDARGDYISYFIYTTDDLYFYKDPSDKKTDTSSGGKKLRIDERDGVIEAAVYGPVNHTEVQRLEAELAAADKAKEAASDYKTSAAKAKVADEIKKELKAAKSTPLTVDLTITKKGDGTADVKIGSEVQTLAEGQWSDWYHMNFKLNKLINVSAITRAKIVSMDEPYFELFLNAIEIDPGKPPFWQPITQPASFSKELESEFGPFETVGWACLTHPLKDKIIDPITFMEDIEFTMKWREEMTFGRIVRDDWRLFMSCLSTPDRVQHMMYQYYDDQHPLYDPVEASRTMEFFGETIELREAIPAIYRQVDRIVGRVMDEVLQPDDLLMIGADHGFQSFRRQMHINNWLHSTGYLAIKSGTKSSNSSIVGTYVDWENTRAYSLGLGAVYLNLKGREGGGIVDPADADELMQQIRHDFLAQEDPDNPGVKVGSNVDIVKEVHGGPYLDLEADMLFGFAPTYRSSWKSASGGISMKKQEDGSYAVGPFMSDNDRAWSGDHVSVDVEHVKGMFFCNRKVSSKEGGVNLMHIAPTALTALGVDVPPEMDLAPLQMN